MVIWAFIRLLGLSATVLVAWFVVLGFFLGLRDGALFVVTDIAGITTMAVIASALPKPARDWLSGD